MMTERVDRWRRGAGACARQAAPLALALVAACSHARGDFVWVDQLAAAPADDTYRIAAGDVLGVRVWNQDALSAPRVRVRNDGKISITILQDVDAEGRTPGELAKELESRLRAYVVNPSVTVAVEEPFPLRVSVVGEVQKPGAYDLEPRSGVLQGLAAAGGFTPFADRDAIFVVRRHARASTAPSRIRFRFEALADGAGPAALFRLRTGDVVVVER